MTARPPPSSWPVFSNPPTSSPCQQCSEIAIAGQPLEGRLDIDAPFRVLFLRPGEGLFHVRLGRGHDAVLMQGRDGPGKMSRSILPEREPRASQSLGENRMFARTGSDVSLPSDQSAADDSWPRSSMFANFGGLARSRATVCRAWRSESCMDARSDLVIPSTYVRNLLAV